MKRGIYLSSAAVHRPFAAEMSEDDRLETADLYGATKAAGELFLRAASAQHQMTAVVVRPGPVVGPPAFAGSFRSPERIREMVCAAAEGRPVVAVGGDGRQFSDVATVARAVRLLTRAADPHPIYTCVDRAIVTWERIAQMVVACSAVPSRVCVVPRDHAGPIPRFRTERIEGLLRGPAGAEGALLEHIRLLCDPGGVGAAGPAGRPQAIR